MLYALVSVLGGVTFGITLYGCLCVLMTHVFGPAPFGYSGLGWVAATVLGVVLMTVGAVGHVIAASDSGSRPTPENVNPTNHSSSYGRKRD